jgi:tyrosyl-tRNA synthetase
MQLKKDLARKIVTDFHSTEAAQRAEEDWAKQFQKHEVPEEVELVTVSLDGIVGAGTRDEIEEFAREPGYFCLPSRDAVLNAPPEQQRKLVRLERLLSQGHMADSASDGMRKIKQKAVRINGQVVTVPHLLVLLPLEPFTVRVGRTLKKVAIQ